MVMFANICIIRFVFYFYFQFFSRELNFILPFGQNQSNPFDYLKEEDHLSNKPFVSLSKNFKLPAELRDIKQNIFLLSREL
jgi:hypothetical protein